MEVDSGKYEVFKGGVAVNRMAGNPWGGFDMFYRLYFNPDNTSSNAHPICYKTDFYMGMISILPWDKKYVDNLIKVFKEQYYPYTLQSRLQEKYRNEEEYKKAVDKICEEEGWSLPSEIV